MARKARPEPYKIKMVEPIRLPAREEREQIIRRAGYNVFNIRADEVFIDFLTDSGTSAMSENQWAGLMLGDESYAGCENFFNLKDAVRDIFGYEFVIPTHQGRAAENILMLAAAKPGTYIVGNMLFDTTEAHTEAKGCRPVNLVISDGLDSQAIHPFKGNIDVDRLESFVKEVGPENVSMIILTVTANNNGGQPVSMANIRETREVSRKYGIPLFFDAARYAENVFFIKQREKGYEDKPLIEIARELFSYGDGCTMSAKKTALVNIGGFVALNDRALYEKCLQFLILYEGFATYGGMAGRDLEALARGLREGLDEEYLRSRIEQVAYLAEGLEEVGVPCVKPPGGHAVYVDCARFLPHIPQSQFPADSLAAHLYVEGAIRAVGLGALAFGKKNPETGQWTYPKMELMRMAIPRRVYTYAHMDYVVEVMESISKERDRVRGLRLVREAPFLRHFLSVLEPA